MEVVKEACYRQPLEQLTTLRNLAAHESTISKNAVKLAVGARVNSAGVWLKRDMQFLVMSRRLRELAHELCARQFGTLGYPIAATKPA